MSSLGLTIKAFAPVNIAWIKYMGKVEGHPANSSLSLTLNSFGTETILRCLSSGSSLKFQWDSKGYVPPAIGIQKVEAFLFNESIWKNLLHEFDFECHVPSSDVLIHTVNNVPAGTGIATSASSFAALTLVWSALLAGPRSREWMNRYESGDFDFRKALAAVAAKGSGSACRSLDGPWVEWIPEDGIKKMDGGKTQWVDYILIAETGHKSVPSSEAHFRVKTSPHYPGRAQRTQKRLESLKSLLFETPSSIPRIRQLVLEESMDMHELFHTSVPSFSYMNSTSHEIVKHFQNDGQDLPTPNAVITLDAGANVHLFVPVNEQELWDNWLNLNFNQLKILKDEAGSSKGARYEVL